MILVVFICVKTGNQNAIMQKECKKRMQKETFDIHFENTKTLVECGN